MMKNFYILKKYIPKFEKKKLVSINVVKIYNIISM